MEAVLSGLSKLGYSWAYREIDAARIRFCRRDVSACSSLLAARVRANPRSILLSGVGPRHPPSRLRRLARWTRLWVLLDRGEHRTRGGPMTRSSHAKRWLKHRDPLPLPQSFCQTANSFCR